MVTSEFGNEEDSVENIDVVVSNDVSEDSTRCRYIITGWAMNNFFVNCSNTVASLIYLLDLLISSSFLFYSYDLF